MLLEVNNLCKSYTKKHKKLIILKDFTYSFKGHNMYLIKGKSGAGKTTLLSLLALLDTSDSGSILFNGNDLALLPTGRKTKFRYEYIGYVFQEFNLFSALTVEENILMAFAEQTITQKEYDKIDDTLKMIGLYDRKYHYASELSGGEKQRVAFARAFVKNPAILICDEPVSNLDDDNAYEIKQLLSNYVKDNECICFITSHSNVFDDIANDTISLESNIMNG